MVGGKREGGVEGSNCDGGSQEWGSEVAVSVWGWCCQRAVFSFVVERGGFEKAVVGSW
jgi:hypothetical protein